MKKNLFQEFLSPDAEYRSKPFWAWNGKLEETELRRQIRLMRQMGMGGFFMHSRTGLATPYLSEEWFRLVNACVDEARRQKMEAWLYDEDRWPSGQAGGLVTRNPAYRQRFLRIEPLRKFQWVPEVLAVFTAEVKSQSASHVRRITQGQRPPVLHRNETFLVFRVVESLANEWWNGSCPVDVLNPEAIARFIKLTHDAYRKHCGDAFGKLIPGIFTDEPCHGSNFYEEAGSLGAPKGSSHVNWTRKLPAAFQKRYGYDLLDHLVEIFFDVDGRAVTPARYHFHECLTHLFVDAYARQIGDWCDKHGLLFTGHVMAEETLATQAVVGGSAMRFYEHMQAPGMDLLTEHCRGYVVAKQVSSVARQFGRRWRITETYGCTGWDFPLAGQKALDNWQVALGINLRCQHLAWYTMEGQAKRDFPASVFFQSPWWEIYRKVEDYFARINAVMTRGVEVRDILVIHPMESAWLLLKDRWFNQPAATNRADARYFALCDTLLQAHLDFDYGDEDILARHGGVQRTAKTPILKVAQASYRTVVVPPMTTMRASTLQLLREFAAAGGSVIFAGKTADYVDAVPSPAVREFAAACVRAPASGAALATAVETAGGRRVSVTDAAGAEIATVLYLLRQDDSADYLFVCNTGHKPRQLRGINDRTMVRDRRESFDPVFIRGFEECRGVPQEFDAESGAIYTARAVRRSGNWEIRTELPAQGSRLFVIPHRKQPTPYPQRPVFREVRRRAFGPERWKISLSEQNPLVLDRPRYRIGTGAWQAADDILRVDHAVRDILHLSRRTGGTAQPWTRKQTGPGKTIPVALAYTFNVATLPEGPLFLAMEQPSRFGVTLNGVAVNVKHEDGWWVDPSLRKVPLASALLCLGTNELRLTGDYDEIYPGLEIIYLLGKFGVRVKGTELTLAAEPAGLRTGDWCRQGLPFYSGSVTYRTAIAPKLRQGERLWVSVPSYGCAAVRVIANGAIAGVLAWEPYEVDITDCLTGKVLDLRIEIIGHRRNSHGPLHFCRKWPDWTGPGEFVSTGKRWVDGYQLVPCGLSAAPELVIRQRA